jgi:hypothetical protein
LQQNFYQFLRALQRCRQRVGLPLAPNPHRNIQNLYTFTKVKKHKFFTGKKW